ncbi:MAG: hypothetical protein K5666_04090 [Bacilli bacterium]|nr:hypothetical protein [Bacilli bacterium]
MDILNNNTFYNGYEGEPEVTFQLVNDNNTSIHLWTGYIDDIMNHQPGTEEDYKYGLSHDWNTLEGPYSNNKSVIDIDDYYKDLERFKYITFEYEETKKAYELILFFLKYAKDNNQQVEVVVE